MHLTKQERVDVFMIHGIYVKIYFSDWWYIKCWQVFFYTKCQSLSIIAWTLTIRWLSTILNKKIIKIALSFQLHKIQSLLNIWRWLEGDSFALPCHVLVNMKESETLRADILQKFAFFFFLITSIIQAHWVTKEINT